VTEGCLRPDLLEAGFSPARGSAEGHLDYFRIADHSSGT
jgi:hypothetical protein